MRNVLTSSLEGKEAGDLNIFHLRCLAQRTTLLMCRSEQQQMPTPIYKQPVQMPWPMSWAWMLKKQEGHGFIWKEHRYRRSSRDQ
uniref:Uncharacterized protein n=1 Tax=Ustilago hordei TaxID=120017 RepID=Q2A736_USTHO|nr:hypothetical protein UHO_0298 [Ustilago hordei]